MKFNQLAILIFAIFVALLAVVDAGSKKKKSKSKPKSKPKGPTQVVKFRKSMGGKSTWFNGKDLKGAACYGNLMGNSNVNAADNWHIGAVHMASYKGNFKAACFECARITYNRRSIIVRLIDDCAGCAPNQIDLTASAFKALAPLSKGVINTKYEFIPCPSRGKLAWPKSPAPKKN
ncbi:hypothetical protein BGW38_007319 [Lunasporangiospora selenospora]|uniref:RlpA-like protein double-psi beta-barrel domain-containing protein n=1 Tax=Lunasporangiospora selenospora TaxID=979761 RepID=A0A9P6G0L8_9FUNG|nr:hypothetical protein BGW38_007319 [Lunasporangiospora selenospora]